MTLAPARPEGYYALGTYKRLVAGDFRSAREDFEKGLRIAPNDERLLGAACLAEQSAGLWDAALQHAREVERLDPRSVLAARRVGAILVYLRRYGEAREALDRALALSPSNLPAILYRVLASLGEGDLAGARAVLQAASKNAGPTALSVYLANTRISAGP